MKAPLAVSQQQNQQFVPVVHIHGNKLHMLYLAGFALICINTMIQRGYCANQKIVSFSSVRMLFPDLRNQTALMPNHSHEEIFLEASSAVTTTQFLKKHQQVQRFKRCKMQSPSAGELVKILRDDLIWTNIVYFQWEENKPEDCQRKLLILGTSKTL